MKYSVIGKDNLPIIDEDRLREQLPILKSPWVDSSGDKTRYYAICSYCGCPMTFVGIRKHRSQKIYRPYGRHVKHSIPGLAEFDEKKYKTCIYSRRYRKDFGNKKIRRGVYDQESINVLNYVKEHVYQIFKEIEHGTGIHMSLKLVESMLVSYKKNTGWTYFSSNISNIPWTLAHIIDNQSLYGRMLLKGSDIVSKLSKLYELTETNNGNYLLTSNGLSFEFRNLSLMENDLCKIDLLVQEVRGRSVKTVFRKKIEFDPINCIEDVNDGCYNSRKEKHIKELKEIVERVFSDVS